MGKSDSGNKFYSRSQAESREVVVDDGIGGGSGDGGGNLKKGPWTASEDAILVEYVKKHGEGNWNAVQKNSGLLRCGKSCRLRWANHLRPNLRKGPFTPDEERLIIELHAKIGNKWARMAAHLPGRTDNEIKNFWNTRVKRLQRVGLPLYPPDVSSETVQESQQGHESGEMVTGGKRSFEALQTNNCDLPDSVFHGYVPTFSDISSYIKMKRFDAPPDLSFMLPAMHSQKHLRQLTAFPGYSDHGNYRFPSFGHLQENSNEKVANRYNFSSYSAPHPACKISLPCSAMQSSQSPSTGNSSASKSTYVAIEEEEELPSFQYPNTDKCGLVETSPPQPLLDPVDTYILTPPENDTFEPERFSPRNSGLLDALVYEGKALCAGKNNCSDKSSHSSAVTRDICNSSNLNVRESAMEDRSDPLSPLGQSATSLLKEHTLVCTSGSSLDEQLPAKSSTGCILKSGPDNTGIDCQGKGITSELTISRPDVILASSLLNQTSEYVKDQSLMNDPLSALYDDFGSDLHSQGWDFSLSSWSNLPPVCQISEQP